MSEFLAGSGFKKIRNFLTDQFSAITHAKGLTGKQLYQLGIIYSCYRIVVSAFLIITSYAAVNSDHFLSLPSLLQQASLIFYFLFSIILLALFYFVSRQLHRQLVFGLAIDIIILSLLLYANGTPDLQLTMLYMVVVAASFMLLKPPQAFLLTLLAIIFVIYQQFFFAIANRFSLVNFTDALIISASFLIVGFFSWSISQRLVHIEKIAAIQAKEVSRLHAINQEVISKMVSGVLVINNNELVLANQAACDLLQLYPAKENSINDLNLLQHQLLSLHPELCAWFLNVASTKSQIKGSASSRLKRQNTQPSSIHIKTQFDAKDDYEQLRQYHSQSFIYNLPNFAASVAIDKLRVEVTPLKNQSQLVILEDLRREQASAQQLKLASLGQLTASIAHEIRNPLAAISQASQLLLEDSQAAGLNSSNFSVNPPPSDTFDENQELYQMIFTQTKRVNRIIEDVLKLSRQQKPDQVLFDLQDWLPKFIAEQFSDHDIFLTIAKSLVIRFDPHQLEQILINLVNNGLKFSSMVHPHAFVTIQSYQQYNEALIDVIDEGAGINPINIAKLFDPFFTTDSSGTGLGLYLSQSFSEANHARLIYVAEHEHTCFRLIIPLAE